MTHVLLDLNGTLTDARHLTHDWPQGAGDGLRALDDAIFSASVDTQTGTYRPLPDHLRAALDRLATRQALDPELVDEAVQRATSLPAAEDAAEALAHLRAGGLTAHVLTNSSAEAGEAALRAAGLREHVDRVLGCDAVQAFKPDPRPYAHALAELGAEAGATWFVAAHWWDVMGAARAGLRTAWVGRDEHALLRTVPLPDVSSVSLLGAAKRITELERRADD